MMDRDSEEFKDLIENPITQMLKTTADFYTEPIKAAADAAVSPAGAMAAIGAAAVIAASYKIYKDYISKAGSHCRKTVPAPNRRRCELEFHLKGKKAQIQKMLNGMHNCKNQECYQKLDSKINQTKREIDTLTKKIGKTPEKPASQPERRKDEVSKWESEESK